MNNDGSLIVFMALRKSIGKVIVNGITLSGTNQFNNYLTSYFVWYANANSGTVED